MNSTTRYDQLADGIAERPVEPLCELQRGRFEQAHRLRLYLCGTSTVIDPFGLVCVTRSVATDFGGIDDMKRLSKRFQIGRPVTAVS